MVDASDDDGLMTLTPPAGQNDFGRLPPKQLKVDDISATPEHVLGRTKSIYCHRAQNRVLRRAGARRGRHATVADRDVKTIGARITFTAIAMGLGAHMR